MARRIALLIGNSEYADPGIDSLSAPWPDVVALDDALREIGSFETTPLLNAGLVEARTAIADLFSECTPDDVILLYYTGHGITDDEGELYFALPQTMQNKLHATSLEADFVKRAMRRSRSSRQVLILDCCYSGAFYREGAKRLGDDARLRKDEFIDPVGRGRYVLAASSARQSAFEVEGQSVFTKYLVNGLKTGAAAPEKPDITIRDIHDHLCRGIAQENMPMQPHLWVDAQTEELVLGRNPNPRVAIPEELIEALYDPDHFRAAGAVSVLIDILNGEDRKYQPDDARVVLVDRMERADGLSYALGRKIDAALSVAVAEMRTAPDQDAVRGHGEAEAKSELKDTVAEDSHLLLSIENVERLPDGGPAFIEVDRGGISIGRDTHLDWTLPDPDRMVSKTHCEIHFRDGGYWLFDVSTNGTFVNNNPKRVVRPHRLSDGDRIQIGRYIVKAELRGVDTIQDWISLMSPRGAANSDRDPWDSGSVFRDVDESWCPSMVVIPAGRFLMGSPEDEPGRDEDEGPQHEVEIEHPFALARYATTFAEYDAFCEGTGREKPYDEGWGRHRHPVINVSWNNAVEYCAWLSEKTGAEYRLPSEAEWEYACRAGTATPYSFGTEISKKLANFDGNSTVPVDCSDYEANDFKLWQMHGNVWEWCADDWGDDYRTPRSQLPLILNPRGDRRVLRGGSWDLDPQNLRSAFRAGFAPENRINWIGFRPARTLLTP